MLLKDQDSWWQLLNRLHPICFTPNRAQLSTKIFSLPSQRTTSWQWVFFSSTSQRLSLVHSAQSGGDQQDQWSRPLVGLSKKVANIPKMSVWPKVNQTNRWFLGCLKSMGLSQLFNFQVTEVLRQVSNNELCAFRYTYIQKGEKSGQGLCTK